MTSEVFYWVLNMSITVSVMGVVVLLLEKIRRVPRGIICVLWGIPFVRMLVPVAINSKFSLMSLISRFTTKTIIVYNGGVDVSVTNSVMLADSYFPISYKLDLLEKVFFVATIIWVVVAVLLLIIMVALYISTMQEIKDANHLNENVYLSDKVTSPTTYGIIKPKIVLPKDYNSNDLKYILMHERVHIKRCDNFWRIVAIATACAHWFNPLSWLFLKRFMESLELACDEKVIKSCTQKDRKAYALTLLNTAQSKSFYVSAFGGSRIKIRIERILSYKKLSAMSVVAFVTLAMAIGYVLLTNAK